MRLPSPTTDVFPSGFAISHNISTSTEGKQNTKPKQQQHKRIDSLDALIMGMFQDKDGNSIDLYDNTDDLPSNVEDDTNNVTQFECKHYHNEDEQFPIVPPDMFFNLSDEEMEDPDNEDGAKRYRFPQNATKFKDCNIFPDTEIGRKGARELYLKLKADNQQTKGSLWYGNRRRYVRGACHKQVEGKFFVVPMQQPYQGYVEGQQRKTWIAPKIRLKVRCFDSTRQHSLKCYVVVLFAGKMIPNIGCERQTVHLPCQ